MRTPRQLTQVLIVLVATAFLVPAVSVAAPAKGKAVSRKQVRALAQEIVRVRRDSKRLSRRYVHNKTSKTFRLTRGGRTYELTASPFRGAQFLHWEVSQGKETILAKEVHPSIAMRIVGNIVYKAVAANEPEPFEEVGTMSPTEAARAILEIAPDTTPSQLRAAFAQ